MVIADRSSPTPPTSGPRLGLEVLGGNVADWVTRVEEMRRVERQLRMLGRWRRPERTLIEVLGLATNEVQNCQILAWALDPTAQHGLGRDLLCSVLGNLGVTLSAEQAALAIVQTEVTRDDSRADIVIRLPETGTTVVIEAKVNAREGERQCGRLESDWPGATLIFLSRNGVAPMSTDHPNRWLLRTWEQLLDQAADVLDEAEKPTGHAEATARDGLRHWLESGRVHLR